MKDFHELLSSGISDELLAAYIDGNTTETENELIENHLNGDSILSEAYEIVSDSITFASNPDKDLHKGDFGFWELGISPIITEEDLLLENEANLDTNELEGLVGDSNIASPRYHIFGEAGENIKDPIFIQQPDDHSCALRSQQIVLRDFGIDIPFSDLEKIALDNGIYSPKGTYTYDIGKILELAGVGMHQVTGTSIHTLINELAQGHRVIVSVDADELWYNNSIKDKLKNWFNDVSGLQGGNHALIVAGIEVNPTNVSDIKIVLTDPGAGHLRIEYPVEQFMDAWKDSNCFMAATDEPAPYQYNVHTGMEEPSNFVIKQHFNKFVEENSYQLSPDKINIPIGYHPSFAGSIDLPTTMVDNSYSSESVCQTPFSNEDSFLDDINDNPTLFPIQNNIDDTLSFWVTEDDNCADNDIEECNEYNTLESVNNDFSSPDNDIDL